MFVYCITRLCVITYVCLAQAIFAGQIETLLPRYNPHEDKQHQEACRTVQQKTVAMYNKHFICLNFLPLEFASQRYSSFSESRLPKSCPHFSIRKLPPLRDGSDKCYELVLPDVTGHTTIEVSESLIGVCTYRQYSSDHNQNFSVTFKSNPDLICFPNLYYKLINHLEKLYKFVSYQVKKMGSPLTPGYVVFVSYTLEEFLNGKAPKVFNSKPGDLKLRPIGSHSKPTDYQPNSYYNSRDMSEE
jgi:hypothetical protein